MMLMIYWDYSGIIVGFNGILMECNGNHIIYSWYTTGIGLDLWHQQRYDEYGDIMVLMG